MITKISTVRNKLTNQIFEVVPGTLLPDFFEEVHKDIRVGEPKVEYEVEAAEPEEKPVEKKKTTKKSKNTRKGAKKNATSKK